MKRTICTIAHVRGATKVAVLGIVFVIGVVMGQDQDLSKQLDAITKTRNQLRGDVQNVDVKLEGAQGKLQDLMRRQAPYADIQFQKERIQGVQREKLKLMTKLLEVEEKRADILVKTQEREKAKAVAEAEANKNRTPKDAPATASPDPPSGNDSTPETNGGNAFSTNPPLTNTLEQYKQTLAQMKLDKARLIADYQAYRIKHKAAKNRLGALPADATQETKVTIRKAIDEYQNNIDRTKSELDVLSKNLLELQDNFEKFVARKNRDDVIMPGQKLELIVAEDKSFNGDYTVRDRGYIILDRVGRVTVAGKTREDAEIAVKEALEKTQLRIATVLLEAARMDDPKEETEELHREWMKARIRSLTKERADIGQDVVYLWGDFNKPGPWPIPKNFKPTLLTTIIRSGGTTKEADLSKMRVLRTIDGKTQSESVDVKGLMEGKAGVLDLKLQPNDIIIAPASTKKTKQNVYLTGSVKKPGAFELSFEKPVTTYTVLLKAGGVSRFANLSKVYILRESGDGGKKIKIPADLEKVKEGKLSDPELKPNDIIVVPESFWGAGS